MPLRQTLPMVQTDIAESIVDAVVNPTNSTEGSILVDVDEAVFVSLPQNDVRQARNLRSSAIIKVIFLHHTVHELLKVLYSFLILANSWILVDICYNNVFLSLYLWFFHKPQVPLKIKLPLGQTLQILQVDVAELIVDAVVNPSNFALYTGGVVGSRLMAVGDAFVDVMLEARRTNTCLPKNESNFAEHKLIAKLWLRCIFYAQRLMKI